MLNKINISSKKQILIVYIVLAFVTLAVFWQVNQYDFINFDDNVYVYREHSYPVRNNAGRISLGVQHNILPDYGTL